MFKKILNRISSAFTSKIVLSLENIVVGLKTINDNFSSLMRFLMKPPEEKKELVCLFEDNDDTKIYRGYSVKINDYITIRQPSLDEIIEYGEHKYYSMVYTLCSVGADLKWQLDDMGVDYTQIEDFELFYSVLSRGFNVEKTKILFGDTIDFSKMQLLYNKQLQENVLVQVFDDGSCLQIDRYAYTCIVSVLRKMHKIKRNDELPGNETTRQILIEDAREEYEASKDKPAKAYLLSLISSVVNSEGFKRNDETVFDMKIYAFMDSVARIGKIKNAELLLQSGYSGFGIDLKKINKDEINWMGDLE